ncbi:hypothetical protein [Hyalangium versicolor]|uniref:hypothetical protein n=1 Tax=Hyalangium versicolor TaxID=2861190 RepID=UPI001CCC58CC|nr:hypothetical protein [Hyalangium versicolor]
MGLRELKEAAHQQFVRGKFAQCAQTYQQVLRLAPRDPNMHVRHAEACRRAGDRLQAIASYRAAAQLLLELGCESRARGALKVALELDPRDPILQAEIARLDPHAQETFSPPSPEALPLLPPLEPGWDTLPPPAPAARPLRASRPEELLRQTALPKIHRALPSAPSVPPLTPPVILPAPRVPSAASGAAQRPAAAGPQVQVTRPVVPPVAAPASATAAPEPSKDAAPRLEIRRLSATTLAFRSSPNDSWAVIRSQAPLEMHVVENLDQLPPMVRDFTVDISVESAADTASSAVH